MMRSGNIFFQRTARPSGHGIGGDECPITVADSLNQKPSTAFDVVLTNPPFGKKSSITVITEMVESGGRVIPGGHQQFMMAAKGLLDDERAPGRT